MAVDKLIDSSKLDACCTAEANAIRAKTGGSSAITYDWSNSKGFADAIAAISGGGDDPYDFTGGNILAIVSHGTEYIDTDYYPSFNGLFCTKLKDVNVTNNEYYWGTTDGSVRTCLQRNSATNLFVVVSNAGGSVAFPGYGSGEVISVLSGTLGLVSRVANKPLLFFRGYYNGNIESVKATYTFYGLNILNTDFEFVARFMPWLDNGVACIKDLISGTIYTNSGTGAFDYIDLEGVTHSA